MTAAGRTPEEPARPSAADAPRPSPASRITWRSPSAWIVLGLMLLNAGLALYGLGVKSLWLDEAVSAKYAELGSAQLWHVVSVTDPNMGLYYVALRVWASLFGDSEVALRSLSVVLGCLAIPVVVALGARLCGARVGLISGLLLALSPFFIHYEQTARAYALVVTVTALSSYLFVRMMDRPSTFTGVAYGVVSALAVYVHYFAALVIVVQFGTLLVVRRRAALTGGWVAIYAGIALLCAPAVTFASRAGTRGIAWITPPTLYDIVAFPGQIVGTVPLAAVLIPLAAFGIYRRVMSARDWRDGYLVSSLLAPVILVLIISEISRPLFVPYYLIIVVPPLLILTASGIAEVTSTTGRRVVLVGIVVLAAVGVGSWYAQPSKNDFRDATHFILVRSNPEDAIDYFPGTAAIGVSYYAQREHRRAPAAAGPQAGLSANDRGRCLWVLIRDSDYSPAAVERRFAAHRRLVEATGRFPGLTVALFDPVTGSSTTIACE